MHRPIDTDTCTSCCDCGVPRPIAWVSTINGAGQTNLAPYSFFNVVSPNPPVLGFSVGPRSERPDSDAYELKDTLLNIKETGEFVVNVVPEKYGTDGAPRTRCRTASRSSRTRNSSSRPRP
jgi:flavin reductase (DIM6/NTAB) family NADH-FMN oxidoreductase RutF